MKIRWKSLMRGRRAAMKDEKNHGALTASAPVATPDATPSPTEKAKPKAAKATPSRQKTRAASPVIKAEKISGAAGLATEKLQGPHSMIAPSSLADLEPADLSLDNDGHVGKIDGLELAAAMGLPSVTDDIVAASIHNFQMSQRYQSNGVANAAAQGGLYPNTTAASQTISPANHAMYASQNGYNVNAVAQQPGSYAMQHGYSSMQSNSSMSNYGVPATYGASAQPMGMSVQGNFYPGMSNGMHNVSAGSSGDWRWR